MATAAARRYRVGTQHGQSLLMRWFPAVKLRQVPMFALEPFDWLAVSVRGTYAVAYMNRGCNAPQRRRRGPCTATKSGALGGPRSCRVTDEDRRGALALTKHLCRRVLVAPDRTGTRHRRRSAAAGRLCAARRPRRRATPRSPSAVRSDWRVARASCRARSSDRGLEAAAGAARATVGAPRPAPCRRLAARLANARHRRPSPSRGLSAQPGRRSSARRRRSLRRVPRANHLAEPP